MSIFWPADLPAWWLAGVRFAPREQTIRTPMDSGVAKVRRTTSSRVVDVDVDVLWTGDEVDRFETWFDDTLEGGALRFWAKHPVTGAAAEYRYRSRPTWSQPPDAPGDRWRGRWRAGFALEILP